MLEVLLLIILATLVVTAVAVLEVMDNIHLLETVLLVLPIQVAVEAQATLLVLAVQEL